MRTTHPQLDSTPGLRFQFQIQVNLSKNNWNSKQCSAPYITAFSAFAVGLAAFFLCQSVLPVKMEIFIYIYVSINNMGTWQMRQAQSQNSKDTWYLDRKGLEAHGSSLDEVFWWAWMSWAEGSFLCFNNCLIKWNWNIKTDKAIYANGKITISYALIIFNKFEVKLKWRWLTKTRPILKGVPFEESLPIIRR